MLPIFGTPEASCVCDGPNPPCANSPFPATRRLSNATLTPAFFHPDKRPLYFPGFSSNQSLQEGRRLDLSYPMPCDRSFTDPDNYDPILAPLGLVPVEHFDEAFKAWMSPPADPLDAYIAGKQGYMWADLLGANEFKYDSNGVIDYSFLKFFQVFPYVEGRNNENVF